nr:hypothetical protein Iba_chr08dCG8810 [Ipomoea batatas]
MLLFSAGNGTPSISGAQNPPSTVLGFVAFRSPAGNGAIDTVDFDQATSGQFSGNFQGACNARKRGGAVLDRNRLALKLGSGLFILSAKAWSSPNPRSFGAWELGNGAGGNLFPAPWYLFLQSNDVGDAAINGVRSSILA